MAMFEPTPSAPGTPVPPSNPGLPPLPPQNFGPPPGMPERPLADPGMAPEPTSAQPKVYTMPEKFRAGEGGGGPRRGSRRLVIILIIVLVVAGLGVAGLYAFQNVFNQPDNQNSNVVINGNRNRNLNTNVNDNQNTNTITNTNANSNGNTNTSNTNTTNQNQNANSNANANTNTSVRTTPLPSSADTDQDGLTDVEEVVYGTDLNKPDTDGDGFIDGKKIQSNGSIIGEVYLGFNPKGSGELEDSNLVKRQANSLNSFSALIPSAWTAVLDQGGGILINPSQATGEFFQIRINSNETRQTPKDWYKTVSPTANVNSLKTDAFNGFEVLWSEDNSTAYLFKDTKVYSIQYASGQLSEVNYWTTFDMIVRSFKLVAAS